MSAISTLSQPTALDEFPLGKICPSLRMTEEEFVAWATDEVRAEWVDGEVILMPPVSLIHTRQTLWLSKLLSEFVERRHLGEVLGPEFMIRFGSQRRRRVPDLLFVSTERSGQLRPNHLEGPPDLSMEIVSPDSQSRDRRDKYLEYEKAGVREYWIVDPLSQTVEAYTLGAAQTYTLIPETDGQIPSTVLPGFHLKPAWLWQEKLPDAIEILRGMGIEF
jgi:Uma2 family endonuclease